MRIVLYYFMCSDKKKTPFGVVIYKLFHSYYFLVYWMERALFVPCNLQLPALFLAVDFIRPSGFKTLRQELSDAL